MPSSLVVSLGSRTISRGEKEPKPLAPSQIMHPPKAIRSTPITESPTELAVQLGSVPRRLRSSNTVAKMIQAAPHTRAAA